MGPYRLYVAGNVPTANACLQLQKACMALFPLRPLLLRAYPQFPLHLALSPKCMALCRVLLSLAWFGRKCGYHMAEQLGLPRY